MVEQVNPESLDAIEMLVQGAGSSSMTPNQSLVESSPSPDNQNTVPADAKRYYCQRCLNHGLEFQRKGHKPMCKFVTCQCDLCMMVEKRRQINNQLQRRNPNTSPTLPEGKRERKPKCARCSAHGVKQDLRGHKKALCPFIGCNCHLCALVEDRRILMAKQIRIRRDQQKQKKRQRASPDTDTASMTSFNEGMSERSSPMASGTSLVHQAQPQVSPFCRVDQLIIATGSGAGASPERDDSMEKEPPTPPKPIEVSPPPMIEASQFNGVFVDVNAALLRLQEFAVRQQLANNIKHLLSGQFFQPQPPPATVSATTNFLPYVPQITSAFSTPATTATAFPMPHHQQSVPMSTAFSSTVHPVMSVVSPEVLLQYVTAMNNLGLLGATASPPTTTTTMTAATKQATDSPASSTLPM
uniref:DM domain-containing protein n=1 Tax=Panagrellus redivivus TaxID=6233 RepID=A0A7E4WDH0_PANRE